MSVLVAGLLSTTLVAAPTPEAHTHDVPTVTPPLWTGMAGLSCWIAGAHEPALESRPRVVVLLHGFGMRRRQLLERAGRLAGPNTTFVFPEAPIALPRGGRAWWVPHAPPDHNSNTAAPPPATGIAEARERILALLAAVEDRLGVESRDILLAGFSQGATLALDVALNARDTLGGLALLSGRLVGEYARNQPLDRLQDTPVLMVHGRWDAIAPYRAAARMRRYLEQAGVSVTWHTYEGGHVISPTIRRQLDRFITRTVARRPGSIRALRAG